MNKLFSSYTFQIRLFLLPYLLGSLILVLIPALATVAAAFTDYRAIGTPNWVGVRNFWQLFESAYVQISLKNTLIFLVLAVPLRVLGALGLALLLQHKGRAFSLYRASVYVPTVIPEVAYALIWLWILNPFYGPLNMLLGAIGLPTPAWLAEPFTAQLSIIILLSFQIGEGFIVLLVGLRNIPRAFYESAIVDGASAWQNFWKITLPLLMPWLMILTFRDVLLSLQNTFTPSFVMTYGGPYYATTFAPLLIYELAFDYFDFGMAAALMLIIYLLMVGLVLGIFNVLGGFGGAD